MKLTVALIGSLLILSCSRGPQTLPGATARQPLSTFSVTVVDRSPATAIIQWTAVSNLVNNDTVKYKIKLRDSLVDSNLTRLTDTLYHLRLDTAYSGRVYAYTKSGDTVSAPFFLEKLKGFIFFGGANNTIKCYDAYSNVMVWQSQPASPGSFMGIPTIANDVLYENGSESGTYAFNAKTGTTIWHTTFPNDYYKGSASNPLYANGTVYTLVASGIYALNSGNGSVLWRYPNTEFTANPVLTGNGLLICAQRSSASAIIAINASTGSTVWADTVNTQICENPVLYDSLVIFGGSDGKIYALNSATGLTTWTKNLDVTSDVYGSAIISPVTYHDLVIVHNRTSGYYGLRASTGAIVWNYPIQTADISSPTIGNDKVYFSCSDVLGEIAVALDAATGQVVWKHVFSLPMGSANPLFAHNRLYFGPTLGGYSVLVLNANTGAEVGLYATFEQLVGGETVVDNDTTYYQAASGMVQ